MPLPRNEAGDRPPRPNAAARPPEMRPSRYRPAWLAAVPAALLVPAAAALLHSGRIPLWVAFTVAFALGVGLATLCFWLLLYRPLSRAAAACRRIDSGNLNLTVPEKGPRPLRELAQVTNNTAADFQEVLLLFAHLVRSALHSARMLQIYVVGRSGIESDRRRAAEIIEDVHQMQEMIREFEYFRVRIDDGTIVDTGIGPAAEDAESRSFPCRSFPCPTPGKEMES